MTILIYSCLLQRKGHWSEIAMRTDGDVALLLGSRVNEAELAIFEGVGRGGGGGGGGCWTDTSRHKSSPLHSQSLA